jgi:hypothetical protein
MHIWQRLAHFAMTILLISTKAFLSCHSGQFVHDTLQRHSNVGARCEVNIANCSNWQWINHHWRLTVLDSLVVMILSKLCSKCRLYPLGCFDMV